jgi:hypothetical protein
MGLKPMASHVKLTLSVCVTHEMHRPRVMYKSPTTHKSLRSVMPPALHHFFLLPLGLLGLLGLLGASSLPCLAWTSFM